jgi:hypothetical protein
MGCGGSKQEDINKSRQRITSQQQPQYGSTQTGGNAGHQSTTASPMSAKKQGGDGEEKQGEYGKSYTDLKNKEKEMFQSIINRTQQSLINISQSPEIDNGEEIEQDQEQQEEQAEDLQEADLSSTAIGGDSYPDLFGLPNVSEVTSSKPLKDVFCENNLTLEDVQMVSFSIAHTHVFLYEFHTMDDR